jgi:succinate-semialdehyde dehydrogenase/glutarate-semialdehyde dehydrogenase
VQRKVQGEFIEKLAQAMETIKMGNGLEAGVDVGPLINEQAIQKCENLLADATSKGAEVQLGGTKKEGLFFSPTLISELDPSMAIFQTEIFGPIAAVYTFDMEEEAITLANDTPFGLAAYFYGRDYARIWRVAEALEYGMVGINTGMISTAVAPFGGIKESGLGREGSKYGIDDFVNIKYMCWGGVE